MRISIKTFFLFTFILLEFISVLAFANPRNATPILNPTADLMRPRVTISFIIARNRDCLGFGICDLSFAISRVATNTCKGTLYVDDYNSSIVNLEIDKVNGISRDTYNKYFSTGTFLMEDNAPLPADIVKELGLIGSKSLIAGKHSVTERNGLLIIAIPVR